MFELLIVVLCLWLMAKSFGLVLKLSWGLAKVVAGALMVLALPMLVLCLLFAGGLVLLVPLGLIALAAGIVKACL